MWIRQQLDTGDEKYLANEASNFAGVERITEWDKNVDAALGRGKTATARTYLRLRNSAGTIYYLSVDTTTLVTSTSQP